MTGDGPDGKPRRRTVVQGGRAKAYRPLPPAARRAAFEAGVEAYRSGDFFLAHELLEPAWMGTRDLGERELIQGVIKLSAAFVHAARGNPAGVEKNLRGARARLAKGVTAERSLRIDVRALLDAIDRRLAHQINLADQAIELERPPVEVAGQQPDASPRGPRES